MEFLALILFGLGATGLFSILMFALITIDKIEKNYRRNKQNMIL